MIDCLMWILVCYFYYINRVFFILCMSIVTQHKDCALFVWKCYCVWLGHLYKLLIRLFLTQRGYLFIIINLKNMGEVQYELWIKQTLQHQKLQTSHIYRFKRFSLRRVTLQILTITSQKHTHKSKEAHTVITNKQWRPYWSAGL